jgi:exosome complex RNA-binding protein Csl4
MQAAGHNKSSGDDQIKTFEPKNEKIDLVVESSSSSGPSKTATPKVGNIVGVCPDCGSALWHVEGCMVCNSCGYSKCG